MDNKKMPTSTDADGGLPDLPRPARKRGRPPIPITEEVLNRRRLSRQRVDASRPKREGPSRKRGRPRRAMAEVILQSPGVSGPTNTASGRQGGEDGDASASQILPECSWKPGTSLAAEMSGTCTSDLNPPASSLQGIRKPELAGDTPRVVVISSGKDSVGKTTTTAKIGLSLARLGFSVVAIDADVGLRNLDLLLGLESRVNYTVVEVLNGDCRLDQALVRDKRFSNFKLLCISKPRPKLPIGFGGKALVWLVDALKDREEGCPDFILIDCPAGIDAGFITVITPANEAVLVTTPDITTLRDADRVIGLLECDGIRDIKMMMNRGYSRGFGGYSEY